MAKERTIDERLDDAILEYFLRIEGFPRWQYEFMDKEDLLKLVIRCLEENKKVQELYPIDTKDRIY